MHNPICTGKFQIYTGQRPEVWQKNMVVHSGSDLLGRLVSGQSCAPNMMYIVFANMANSSDPYTQGGDIVAVDTDATVFAALTSPVDYQRVPIIASSLSATANTYTSNAVTFYAETYGAVGKHQLTFSAGSYSRIFGVALVYASDATTQTSDIVFSCGITTGSAQIIKPASGNASVAWQITF